MKRYCKAGKTFLSLVLIGALLMQLLPFNVFAVESGGELETSSANGEQSLDIEDTSASVLGELESERDEYVKRFAMSDGTIQAVRYEIPVHYLNDDGEWCDYNKAISETNALIDQQDVVFGEVDEDYLDNPIQENDDNEGRDDKELVQEQENTSLPEENALDERDSEIFSDGQENNFTVEQEPSDVILDEELDESKRQISRRLAIK